MRYKFTIPGRLPGMNEYTSSQRANRYVGAKMKASAQQIIQECIWNQLGDLRITKKVDITYLFAEPNDRRDKDNISGFAHKVIQDALVACHTIEDDGWKNIGSITDNYQVDKADPHILVVLNEVE